MNYRILEEGEYEKWDEFVNNSPQGSIYAKSFYLKSIGCSFSIGVVENDGRILGGFVLGKNEAGVYSNPLFVKFLGILYADTDEVNSKKERRKYKIDQLIIDNLPQKAALSYSFHPNYNNWINFYWNNFSQTSHYTYQIRFSESADFRKNYIEKAKGPLRTAKKYKLKVTDVDMKSFIRVNKKTYKARNGRAPYSDERLEKILNNLSINNCLLTKGVVDEEGNIHAVAAIVYDHRSANLILNGSDPVYRKYSGNSLLIDYMIEFASENCELFDFEGSMHQRIEKFYHGFGGEITPYFVISKNNLITNAYLTAISFFKRIYS